MSYKIIKNKLEITLEDKLNEIKKENIIESYSLIKSFKSTVKKEGNTITQAYIKARFLDRMEVTEYINILRLIKEGTFAEYVDYFKNFEEKHDSLKKIQKKKTRVWLDDYINDINYTSQKIIIETMFSIENKDKEVEKRKDIFKRLEYENLLEIYEEI